MAAKRKPRTKRAVPRPIGRPSRLTPAVHDTIVTTVRAGNYFSVACERAGINPTLGHEWMARGKGELMEEGRPPWAEDDPMTYPDDYHEIELRGEGYPGRFAVFADAVIRAGADAEAHAVGTLRAAMVAGDTRAAVEWLKRRHPDRWREEQYVEQGGGVEHTHRAELPDEEKLAAILDAWREAGIDPSAAMRAIEPGPST